MPFNPEITVVMTTKDRVEFAILAIKSLLAQKDISFTFIISDLSRGDSLYKVAKDLINLSPIIYRRITREPLLITKNHLKEQYTGRSRG